METKYYDGKRLSYDGNLCTVRYVGPVAGTEGLWLGVEWDDPSRGKHSGVHNGVKYFDCRSKHPASGSFVRPNRPYQPARSFIEAVREKYANNEAVSNGLVENPLKNPEKAVQISGKEVEEVGFDKIRKQMADLQSLRIVLVDGFCINRPKARKTFGDSDISHIDDIIQSCPGILDLDLSRNLFEEYGEIVDICRQLRGLQTLKISGNKFRSIDCSDGLDFPILKSLSLDETFLDWEQIITATSFFSHILTLSASANCLSRLQPLQLPMSCTSLTLESNDFQYLSDLSVISKAPNLVNLKLKSNRIFQICGPDYKRSSQNATLVFSKTLDHVDLSSNLVDSWQFIDDLALSFPGMTSLRISGNPLFVDLKAANGKDLPAEDGYMFTIARLGHLKSLNFSQIAPKERLNSDTYYLSQIAYELSSASENAAIDIISRHPRYQELCAQYGPPAIQRASASLINPNTIEARLVRLSIVLEDLDLEFSGPEAVSTLKIEIPKMLSIYGLLGIVGRKLKVRPLELQLVWETGEWDLVQDETDEDMYYEDSVDIQSLKKQGKVSQTQRKELLVPKTRPIGSWIDTSTANLRVQWSEEDRNRFKLAQTESQVWLKTL